MKSHNEAPPPLGPMPAAHAKACTCAAHQRSPKHGSTQQYNQQWQYTAVQPAVVVHSSTTNSGNTQQYNRHCLVHQLTMRWKTAYQAYNCLNSWTKCAYVMVGVHQAPPPLVLGSYTLLQTLAPRQCVQHSIRLSHIACTCTYAHTRAHTRPDGRVQNRVTDTFLGATHRHTATFHLPGHFIKEYFLPSAVLFTQHDTRPLHRHYEH